MINIADTTNNTATNTTDNIANDNNNDYGEFVEVLSHPTKIDTIVFDIGGILSFEDPNFQLRLGNWAVTHESHARGGGVLLCDIISWLLNAWKMLHDCGEHFPLHIAKHEFEKFMPTHCSSQLINEFFEFMGSSRIISKWYYDLLNSLKKRGYKLYYLSDICQYNLELQVRSKKYEEDVYYLFNTFFDGGVFSYETPWRKPDPRIYQLLIDKYGINPETSAFFDDKPKNAEVAALDFGFWSKVVKPSIHEMEGLAILLDETTFPDLTKIKGKEEK